MTSKLGILLRCALLGSLLGVLPLSLGCSSEPSGTTGEAASPDIRANLEKSAEAASEVAKEKPKAK